MNAPIKKKKRYNNVLTLHAVCNTLTPYGLSSAAIYPSEELQLICVGDTTGSLGMWLPGDIENSYEDEAPIGKHCLYKPHYGKINYMCFNKVNNYQLVTCSDDGFVRLIDLSQGYQMIDLVYNWSHHNTTFDQNHIYSCLSLSENEYLISKQSPSHENIVFLYDARQKQAALDLHSEMNQSLIPRISINPNDAVTVATLGKAGVFLHDIRMPCLSKKCNYMMHIPCTEPTQADFSTNGSNELLICSRDDSIRGKISKHAKIYNTLDLLNASTLESPSTPPRIISNISQVRELPSDKMKKYENCTFQLDISELPNSMCNNQAVWHPNIPGYVVVSTVSKFVSDKNLTPKQHQIEVISETGEPTGFSVLDELPFECHKLISSRGGICLINSRMDGIVSLLK